MYIKYVLLEGIAMTALNMMLQTFLWPGDRFCAWIEQNPKVDSGMLRGFINSIVWGIVVVLIMLATW